MFELIFLKLNYFLFLMYLFYFLIHHLFQLLQIIFQFDYVKIYYLNLIQYENVHLHNQEYINIHNENNQFLYLNFYF